MHRCKRLEAEEGRTENTRIEIGTAEHYNLETNKHTPY